MEGTAVLAVLSTLIIVAVPAVDDREDRMHMVEVRKDFGIMEARIQRYFAENGEYPGSLEEIGLDGDDPWGNPYRYVRSADEMGNGQVRTTHLDAPVNRDFDLYSTGPDGSSLSHLVSLASRDDILRAERGSFVDWSTVYCTEHGC